MTARTALVVTSIASPNRALTELAAGAVANDVEFLVIGDLASPDTFELDGCRFYGVADQQALVFRTAAATPTRHYARKNIGYLLAASEGAEIIVETDDDNHPRAGFWAERSRHQHVKTIPSDAGWVNVYRHFSDTTIWPRGLPLDAIRVPGPPYDALDATDVDCPIQQGLADDNPDVDAIYRLSQPLPQSFCGDRRVVLAPGTWSPFNSQNTAWWRDAFALLYLPAHCSFRMTDIWRSFVAQRIAWENGWSVLFHEPTVRQERNDHDLMADFAQEIPGYVNNRAIGDALAALTLAPGLDHLGENLRRCYAELVKMDLVGDAELDLLDAWLADVADLAV